MAYRLNGFTQYNSLMEGAMELIEYNQKVYEGFYVSYNDIDSRIYGCTTTALVLGQMQKFYILKGDHREAYAQLINEGFHACLAYYIDNIDLSHNHSDKL